MSLNTERTQISPLQLEDSAFFLKLVNTPGWLRFIGDRGISSEPQAREFLQTAFLNSLELNGFGYDIVRLIDGSEPVGICGFLKKPELQNPDFGFAFLPDHCGRGLATEACQAVLKSGVREFGFTVVDAVTMEENHRSIHLLERLGFEAAGAVSFSCDKEPLLLFRQSFPQAKTG